MPHYEFECLKCGKTFAEILTLREYEKSVRKGFRCPKCQSKNVQQTVHVQVQTSKKS
jgi:putative FmdB family regulatory protein